MNSADTHRLVWICLDCGNFHLKRGPLSFCMRAGAMLLDQGSPAVQITQEAWSQCYDMDFHDWLAEKGIVLSSEVEWGGFRHRTP